MATSSQTPTSAKSERSASRRQVLTYDQFVDDRLGKVRSYVKLRDLAAAMLITISGTLLLVAVLIVVDHWCFDLGFAGRVIGLGLLLSWIAFCIIRHLIPPALRSVNPAYAAKVIEESEPGLKNRLLNFVFFRDHRTDLKEVVYQAVRQEAATELTHVEVESTVDYGRLVRFAAVMAALVMALGIYTVVSPKNPFATLARILAPWKSIPRPARVLIEDVEPGTTQAYFGRSVSVSARVERLPADQQPSVLFSSVDQRVVDERVMMSFDRDSEKYTATLPPGRQGLRQDLIYQLEAGDAIAGPYRIQVVPAPSIVVERIEYEFPIYTQQSPEVVEGEGDISGVEGTRVTIHASTNQLVSSAYLEFDPDSAHPDRSSKRSRKTIRMNHDAQTASVSFTLLLRRDGRTAVHSSYQLRFQNEQNEINSNPIRYHINVLPDLKPEVEILTPTVSEVDIPVNSTQPIEVRAFDPDFRLSQLALQTVELGGDEKHIERIPLLTEPAAGQVVKRHLFVPGALGLRPGQTVMLRATASDNRHDPNTRKAKPNTVSTKDYRLHIVEATEAVPPDQPQQQTPSDRGAQDGSGEPGESGQQQARDEADPDGESSASSDQNDSGEGGMTDPGDESASGGGSDGDSQSADDGRGGGGGPSEQAGDSTGAAGEQDAESSRGSGDRNAADEAADGEESNGESNAGESSAGDRRGGSDQQNNTERGDDSESGDQGSSEEEGTGTEESRSGDPSRSADQRLSDQDQSQSERQRGENAGDREKSQDTSQSGDDTPLPSDGSQDADVFDRIMEEMRKSGEQEPDESSDQPQSEQQPDASESARERDRTADESQSRQAEDERGEETDGRMSESGDETESGEQSEVADEGEQEPSPTQEGSDAEMGERQASEEQAEAPDGQGQQPSDQPDSEGQPSAASPAEQQSGESSDQTGNQEGQESETPPQGERSRQTSDQQGEQGDRQGGTSQGQSGQGQQGAGAQPGREPGGVENPAGAETGEPGETGEGQSSPGQTGQEGRASENEGQRDNIGQSSTREGGDTMRDGSDPSGTDSQQTDESGSQSGEGQTDPSETESGTSQNGQPVEDSQQGEPGSAGTQTDPDSTSADRQPPGSEQGERSSGESSGEASASGETTDQPGQQSGQESGDQDGSQASDQTTRSRSTAGETPGQGGERRGPDAPPSNESLPEPGGDPANMEYAKKATELVLDYLEHQREEPDPELLERLGWTKEDLNRFMNRWEQMQRAARQPGEAGKEAQRELDQALRSLGLQPAQDNTQTATDAADALTDVSDAGTRGRPPAQYREAYKAFMQRRKKTNGQQ